MNHVAKEITEQCFDELTFKTSRSSGAGGQHVNKVETRVTLRWDVKSSMHLSTEQKAILADRLSNYMNKEGELVISDESSRSQLKNKENVIRKWKRLLTKAFFVKKKRKRTSVPRSVVKARQEEKKRRSEIKKARRKPRLGD